MFFVPPNFTGLPVDFKPKTNPMNRTSLFSLDMGNMNGKKRDQQILEITEMDGTDGFSMFFLLFFDQLEIETSKNQRLSCFFYDQSRRWPGELGSKFGKLRSLSVREIPWGKRRKRCGQFSWFSWEI